jgi:DNA polymerase-3 subunit epsilon
MYENSDFVAIDFETAVNHHICAVGIVSVKDGKIVEEYHTLIQPPNNKYNWHNTNVHGIVANDTKNTPLFDSLFPEIEKRIKGQTVVAHNESFDRSVLMKTMRDYKLNYEILDLPNKWECTYRLHGSALNICCEKHNIELKHHEALSDAKACAELYLIHLKNR